MGKEVLGTGCDSCSILTYLPVKVTTLEYFTILGSDIVQISPNGIRLIWT